MRWTWSEEKNRRNKRNHRLSFEVARLVFDDPLAVSRVDPHPDGDRWQTLGRVGTVLIFVVHTSPEPGAARTRKPGESSVRGRQHPMKGEGMKKASSSKLTQGQRDELAALAVMPEAAIDTRDIPEQRDWSGAKRGVFYRPVKQQLTLRLDADIIAWFKSRRPSADGYQTRINDALRAYVEQHEAD